MSFQLFCMNRPHYPYECSREEMKLIGMVHIVDSVVIHEPERDAAGEVCFIRVSLKPKATVEYIHFPLPLPDEEKAP